MIHYFAYGSNLHPVRLTERIASAKLVGSTQLDGYQLMFHKQGKDDSAKCNILHTGIQADIVHGAIYTLAAKHKHMLDNFEGKGAGYIDREIDISYSGQIIRCFTYIAQEAYIVDSLKPFHWYKQLVIQGAHYLKFPPAYQAHLKEIKSLADPDPSRRRAHETLLRTIMDYPSDSRI